MATISDSDVDAEARWPLREQLTRSAWFRTGMTAQERRKRIELEVDAWWHLKAEDVAKQLIERATPEPLKQAS
jgi:hypothetical protein